MRNGAGNVCATGSWSSPISTSTSTRIPALVLPMPNSLCHSPPAPSLFSGPSCCPCAGSAPSWLASELKRNATQSNLSLSQPVQKCHIHTIPYHAMPCHTMPDIQPSVCTVYMLSWRTFAPRPIPLMSVNQGNCYFFNNFSLALCLSRERLSYESRNPAQSQSQS